MKENYHNFVERMISRYEGGYGWSREDKGGPTKFGITCYDLAEYLHEPMNSMKAWAPRVKAMPLTTADEIYKTKYASAKGCRFDDLPSGCDCVVFDFGVNSGPSRAIKFAQQVVHVAADGNLGPATLKAINDYDPEKFINELCNARMGFLRGRKNWGTFGRGWTARVKDLRQYSLALATKSAKKLNVPQDKERTIPKAFAKALTR